MKKLKQGALMLALAIAAYAWDDVVSVLHGTVTKMDHAAKVIVVKTADGTERTLKVASEATMHGAKEGFEGLKEGTEVVVHYTVKGGEETAVEVGKVGKDGLKVAEGTITKVDRGSKTATVKTADGTEAIFQMTGHAAESVGQGVGAGAEKTAKVTVYYTEEAGKKVAHFFER